MTPLRRKARATYEDLLGLPETVVGELLGGELFASPRPAPRHARATSALGFELAPFDRGAGGPGPGGWIILDEPELHLGLDVLVPDLAGWRRERLPGLPEGGGIEVAPNWVCEVVSPSTGALDRTRKMPIYARQGVRHLWLIDPLARSLEVFRLEDGRWSMIAAFGEDAPARVRAEPFAELDLDLARCWWPEAQLGSVG